MEPDEGGVWTPDSGLSMFIGIGEAGTSEGGECGAGAFCLLMSLMKPLLTFSVIRSK